jgi:alkylation response protein AidB-like acyl-CoA dehydrogenase
LDFSWSEEQLQFRSEVIRFAQRELTGGDGSPEWFSKSWKKCADFGILGLPVAEDYGGAGASNLTVAMTLEALGYACSDNGLIFSLNAQMWAGQYPIERFGTAQQRATYLPRLCSGDLIIGHAMSEPGAGSDAFGLTTSARPEGDGFVLNGSKTFVTNAPVAGVFLVFARLPDTQGFAGVSAFLVDRDTPGLHVTRALQKMGLKTSPMGEVFFDDCHVPSQAPVGRLGGGMAVFSAAMERERSMILASTIGSMERNLERSLAHASERRQFGQPIGKFQAVSHRLVEMKLRLETARLLLYRLAWLIDNGEPSGLDSALVKVYLSESYVASSLDALQIHGGYGYIEEYGLAGEVSDALASRLYSGTSDIQRNLAARYLGL